MRFLLSLLLTGLTIFIAVYFTPGAEVKSFFWAIIAGLLIGLVNSSIGFVLRIFTFPINLLTFGLVSFLITTMMILFTDFLMGSKFIVGGFWNAVIFAIIVAIIDMIIGAVFKKV